MSGHGTARRLLGTTLLILVLALGSAVCISAQQRRRYHGIDLDLPQRRCSMEIRGADVADVLRTFADQYNLNLVLGEDVIGRIDLVLNQVPVDDAFLTILRSAKLAYVREGDIYRIMSLEKLANENELREKSIRMETRVFKPSYASAKRLAESMKNILSRRESAFIEADERTNAIVAKDIPEKLDEMETLFRLLDVENVTAIRPVKTEVVSLKFVEPQEMGKNVQSMLSAAGKVEINTKTNSLIISDLPENLGQIRQLVESIDQPSRQVLIEARVVETTKGFSRALGIQWGGTYYDGTTRIMGTASVSTGDGTTATTTAATTTEEPFAVNLPIHGGSSYGGIGLTTALIDGKFNLDVRLNAMEENGEGRILSTPRIATLDNTQALIEIGSRVPYRALEEGTEERNYTVKYTDALTRLEVTPHITSDKRIKMKINADKDRPDWSRTVDGNPLISRKGAQTELIVRDGETTVIGGLAISENQESRQEVPLFSKIPLIGALFRNKFKTDSYDELLIFITPHIIEN
ncbi:MAG: type IV pilus secretin PilQ [bacterium]